MTAFNPMNILAMMKSGGNPNQIAINAINQVFGNTPMGNNLKTMIQNNDYKGIENFARNLAKERNIDPEKAFNQTMQQMHMK